MRVTLKQFLELLGIGHVMSPYETCPWSYYDAEQGLTCSAEVRMGMESDEVEAEIQMLYDEPRNGSGLEQIMWMRATPHSDKWSPTQLRVKSIDDHLSIYDWETKSCKFFTACVQAIQMEEIPDIDELIDSIFHSRERMGGMRGGSSKSPKIKPGQLMNMKKGGF